LEELKDLALNNIEEILSWGCAIREEELIPYRE